MVAIIGVGAVANNNRTFKVCSRAFAAVIIVPSTGSCLDVDCIERSHPSIHRSINARLAIDLHKQLVSQFD